MSDHEHEAHCTSHPHCVFCGGIELDEGDRVVCVNCGTVTPVDNRKPAEVSS
jgi:hypothetical protein